MLFFAPLPRHAGPIEAALSTSVTVENLKRSRGGPNQPPSRLPRGPVELRSWCRLFYMGDWTLRDLRRRATGDGPGAVEVREMLARVFGLQSNGGVCALDRLIGRRGARALVRDVFLIQDRRAPRGKGKEQSNEPSAMTEGEASEAQSGPHAPDDDSDDAVAQRQATTPVDGAESRTSRATSRGRGTIGSHPGANHSGASPQSSAPPERPSDDEPVNRPDETRSLGDEEEPQNLGQNVPGASDVSTDVQGDQEDRPDRLVIGWPKGLAAEPARPTRQQRKMKGGSRGDLASSREARASHGGCHVHALTPETSVGRAIYRELRRILRPGDGSEPSPRVRAAALVRELVTRRVALSRARREEAGQELCVLAIDVSGSCSSFCSELWAAASAVAADTDGVIITWGEEADKSQIPPEVGLVVVQHSNGICKIWDREISLSEIVLSAGRPLATVLAFGDCDAEQHYRALHNAGARVVWLDNFSSSHGPRKAAPRDGIETVLGVGGAEGALLGLRLVEGSSQ